MRDMQATGRASVEAGASQDEGGTRRSSGRGRLVVLTAVALVVVLADLASKVWAVARLSDGHSVKVFGGFVYFALTRNTGAAFSLASGFTVVLSALAVAIIVVIVRTARRLTSTWWAVALGLVLGGAVGNLADRIFRSPGVFRGAVVDFISLFDPVSPPWPVFNLADSALVLGVIIAVVLEFTGHGMTDALSPRRRSSARTLESQPPKEPPASE